MHGLRKDEPWYKLLEDEAVMPCIKATCNLTALLWSKTVAILGLLSQAVSDEGALKSLIMLVKEWDGPVK